MRLVWCCMKRWGVQTRSVSIQQPGRTRMRITKKITCWMQELFKLDNELSDHSIVILLIKQVLNYLIICCVPTVLQSTTVQPSTEKSSLWTLLDLLCVLYFYASVVPGIIQLEPALNLFLWIQLIHVTGGYLLKPASFSVSTRLCLIFYFSFFLFLVFNQQQLAYITPEEYLVMFLFGYDI